MKVVIIGSGNVGTVLGKKIAASGHEILQVAGRNSEKLTALSSLLKTNYTTNLQQINRLADIYIIAVPDYATVSVAQQLHLVDKLVVHTAASVAKDVLKGCSTNYGVLYPLQSLRSEALSIPPIPVLVDGNSDYCRKQIILFSCIWADNVTIASDEERLKLHLAAVFVNNFTNHLYALAQIFCTANLLDFSVLQPIIEETIARLKVNPAFAMQTGPAVRKDMETIKRHQQLLSDHPALLHIYNTLTSSIIDLYRNNKM